MAIKYEIQSIKNVQNTGRERRFARIFEQEPMTVAELEAHIQDNCTLTRRDLEREFGMRQTVALKWLRQLTASGVLRKEGARTAPVYFMNE